jgi:hypothetical protein
MEKNRIKPEQRRSIKSGGEDILELKVYPDNVNTTLNFLIPAAMFN